MNKTYKMALAAGTLSMAFPLLALAASFTNVEFQNGQTTVEGSGSSQVTAMFRVVVPVNEVVERIQTDVIGDGLAPVCTEVGGSMGLEQGTHNVSIQVKLPPNTGTYNLDVQGSGIFGAFKADDCVGDVVGSASFANALRVVASGSGSTGSTSALDIAAIVKAVLLSMGIGSATTTPPVATVSEVCKAYAQANSGTQSNVYSDANVRLQGFLLSQGASIPALKAGAAFGFYGNQTTAAVGWFNSLNHCGQ